MVCSYANGSQDQLQGTGFSIAGMNAEACADQ